MDDIEAIKQLKARYFRTMDTKDWDAMRQVFTDDVASTRPVGGRVIPGADEFIAYLKETIGDVVTVHHGHMPEIELTSATTATGVWSMEDMIGGPTARDCTGTATTTRRTRRSTVTGGSRRRR